jgi:hypothetical protein
MQHRARIREREHVESLPADGSRDYNRRKSQPTLLEDISHMTRTPTTIVTASVLAARAFAWEHSIDARMPGIALPDAPQHP